MFSSTAGSDNSPEANVLPVRLGLRARIATLGSWKALREYLNAQDADDRLWLQNRLHALANCLYNHPRDYRSYRGEMEELFGKDLPALSRTLAPEQFKTALALALRLAERYINPYNLVRRYLPNLNSVLTGAQFSAGLALVDCLIERGIDPTAMLDFGLINSVRALTPEQLEAVLPIAVRLAENRMDPAGTLGYGFPAIARVVSPEQFENCLSFALELAAHHINPTVTLQSGILALVRSGLDSDQFSACLVVGIRLARQSIDPAVTFQHGIPIIASASPNGQMFQVNLHLLEKLIVLLTKQRQDTGEFLRSCLRSTARMLPSAPFSTAMEVAVRLAEHKIYPDSYPGLIRLTDQAIMLKQYYNDFIPVQRKAITHMENDYGSYVADGRSKEVIDYPAWVELQPQVKRSADYPLTNIETGRLEMLLLQRSWMWRYETDLAGRERALERIAELRIFLPEIISRLRSSGILEPAPTLESIYLVGSYPYAAHPNNIDLIVITEGEQQAARFTSKDLAERGIPLSEPLTKLVVEIVGYQTLLTGSREIYLANTRPSAFRYPLLFGSALLAGVDLFENVPVPKEALEILLDVLLADAERADWPELNNNVKIQDRKIRRRAEAGALAKFLRRPACIALREVWPLFMTTQDADTIRNMAPFLAEAFHQIARAAAAGQEQTALQEFQARYEVNFRVVRDNLRKMRGLWGVEGVRREAAQYILAVCSVRLQIDELLTASQSPATDADTLLIPAGFTDSDDSELLRPGQSPPFDATPNG